MRQAGGAAPPGVVGGRAGGAREAPAAVSPPAPDARRPVPAARETVTVRDAALDRRVGILELRLLAKDAQIEALTRQLDDARQEVVRAMAKLRTLATRAEAASGMAEAEIAVQTLRGKAEHTMPELDQAERRQLNDLSRLLRRRRELERQIATLRSAHKLMSAWHTVHVPLGVTLFLSAFLHVIGTFYYGAVKLF